MTRCSLSFFVSANYGTTKSRIFHYTLTELFILSIFVKPHDAIKYTASPHIYSRHLLCLLPPHHYPQIGCQEASLPLRAGSVVLSADHLHCWGNFNTDRAGVRNKETQRAAESKIPCRYKRLTQTYEKTRRLRHEFLVDHTYTTYCCVI